MSLLLIVSLAALALIQFSSKRSAGMPLIGLIVGSIVVELWASDLIAWLARFSWAEGNIALSNLVMIIILTLPALALMFVGKKGGSKLVKIVSALAISLFAGVILIDKLGPAAVAFIEPAIKSQIVSFRPTIIGIVAVLATVDVVLQASAKKR